MGSLASLWSSTQYTSEIAWHFHIQKGNDGLGLNYYHRKSTGHAVRCIKD